MSLETGLYIIRCKGTESYIGRSEKEETSLLPKPIINLPKGVQAPRFFVEKSRTCEGAYVVRAMEGLVGEEKGLLWGFLAHDAAPPTTTWFIHRRDQHGEHMYTVEKPNTSPSQGWIVPEAAPYTQVAVKPLSTTKSLPPQYQPQALFEFVSINRVG